MTDSGPDRVAGSDERCAYIFLDESGNLAFNPSGTRYFVMTSVSLVRPFPWGAMLDDLKYDCIEFGQDLEDFHCGHDNFSVRRDVFNIIARDLDAITIDYLVVDKPKTAPEYQDASRFYSFMLDHLLRHVVSSEPCARSDKITVITDTIPVKKKRLVTERKIRRAFMAMAPPGRQFTILHHDSRSHYGLQVADYCSWALYRTLQQGDSTYFDKIASAVREKLEIYRGVESRFYQSVPSAVSRIKSAVS